MADYSIDAKAMDINLIGKFETDLHNLQAVLSQADVQVVAPGTAWKIYKSSGTLSAAAVAEKALIPDSGIAMGAPTVKELTYGKYRNLTSIEKIGKLGYDVAVGGSNRAVLKDIQKGIRTTIFTALGTGTGTDTVTTTGLSNAKIFQKKVAKAAAYVSKKFEDEAHTPIIFVSPDDAFEYLGEHDVTLENDFGLSYLKNFLGIGNVIIDSNVPAGTVYGTAAENIAIVATSIASIPGMELTTDETGIIAVKNGPLYSNAAVELVAFTGISVQPYYTDRIVKVTSKG